MLSISDEHKEAIIRLINAIISDSPVVTNLTDRSKVSLKLVKLIHYFEHSVNSGNKSLLLLKCLSFEALIENWLLNYYCEDSVMESFAIEDGVEQELSTASLLILYVIHKFSVCFPHIVMYFNDNWNHLQEFNTRLDQMLKTEKIIKLLYKQIDGNIDDNCEPNATQRQNHLDLIENNSNEDLTGLETNPIQTSVSTNSGSDVFPAKNRKTNPYMSSTAEELIVPQLLEPESHRPTGLQRQTGAPFSCNDCNRTFASKYKLRRHEFVHRPLSKPFGCPWNGCELRFRSSFDMRRHFVTHTGERPFVCDICLKRFSRADKLKEHKLIHKRSDGSVKQRLVPNILHNINDGQDFRPFDINLFESQITSIKTELNL